MSIQTRPNIQANPLAEFENLNSRELKLALQKMNMGQKKLMAMKGNAAIRRVLLRDPNFEVQMAVINSPKTGEGEIETIAGLPSTAEVVLKAIFSNGRWMKSYRIKHKLATNPKTPIGIVQRCLRILTTHDLKKLCHDPYIRKPVQQSAQRLLKTRR